MKVAISKCLAVGMAVGLSFGAFAEDAYVDGERHAVRGRRLPADGEDPL